MTDEYAPTGLDTFTLYPGQTTRVSADPDHPATISVGGGGPIVYTAEPGSAGLGTLAKGGNTTTKEQVYIALANHTSTPASLFVQHSEKKPQKA